MPALSRNKPEVEYLDGFAHPKVSPKQRHGVVQGAVYAALHACAKNTGSVCLETRFHPGPHGGAHTRLVPDVAFVRRERLMQLRPQERQEPPFSPDVAVEVRSPSDDISYLKRKIERYLATGAVLVLDVDPAARAIRAHSSAGVAEYGHGDPFRHPAAAWLRFDVDAIFSDLDEYGL